MPVIRTSLPPGDARAPPAFAADQSILDLLLAAVCVVDAEGGIVRYNPKAVELWGQAPAPDDRYCGAFRLLQADGRVLPRSASPAPRAIREGASVSGAEVIIEQPNGRRHWALFDVALVKGQSGRIEGAVASFQDITARKQAQAGHAATLPPAVPDEGEKRFREVLEAMPVAIYTTNAAGRITFYNRAAADFWGFCPQLGQSEWCGSWRLRWPDGTPMRHEECPMAVAIKEGRPVYGQEAIAERPDGSLRPFAAYPTPLRDESGTVTGTVNIMVDIAERKRGEQRLKLLVNELNHRVKNTLATVQSIAMQSFGYAAGNSRLRIFEGRLIALSHAHNLLTSENWEGARLRDVVDRVAAPLHGAGLCQFDVSGPSLWLRPKMALAMAMAMHELAINAAKFGSLSTPAGRVSVTWRVNDAGRLHFRWAESGGPPVQPPESKGFGGRLLEEGLSRELDGTVRLQYLPEGLVWEADASFASD